MSVRVYQFGLLPPTENEALVRAQLRAAHEYRNTLVAIERGRRAALRALDDTAETHEAALLVRAATRSSRGAALAKLRAARKAARAAAEDAIADINLREKEILLSARAATTCFWGTYLDIEDAHRRSRMQPLYGPDGLSPNDPAFQRGPRWRDSFDPTDPRATWWLKSGQIGMQLQGGLSTADARAGTDRRVRVIMGPAGKRGRRYGVLWLRVGSDGREPIWAQWPIKMHRAVPDAGTWKWVRVSVRPEGLRERWTVEITVDDPTPRPRELAAPTLDGVVAIEWEWTPLEDGGLRVARYRSASAELPMSGERVGVDHDVILPARIVQGIQKPNGIRSVRDTLMNALRDPLARAILDDKRSPEWARAEARTMHLWKGPARFRAMAMRWRREGLPEPRKAYEILDAWEERENHLYEYESHARGEALRERREFFRILASRWSRLFRTLLVSDQDLSREARWGDDGDMRFVAGVSEFRQALRNAFGADALDAKWKDRVHEDDERPWRERTLARWFEDADKADAFEARKTYSGNAWKERRAKAKGNAPP